MMELERPIVRSWIRDSGIILAIVTAMTSFCVLAYQRGYNSYFNIPSQFTSLSTTVIVGTSLPTITLFLTSSFPLFTASLLIIELGTMFRINSNKFLQYFSGLVPGSFARALSKAFLVSIVLLLPVSSAGHLGRADAKIREQFYTIHQASGLPEVLVVIQIYDEYLVAAPLVRSMNENQIEKILYP
jgi:hypothetical protein